MANINGALNDMPIAAQEAEAREAIAHLDIAIAASERLGWLGMVRDLLAVKVQVRKRLRNLTRH